MEPSSEAGVQAGDMRRGEGAVVPATEGAGRRAPFRLGEDAELSSAVRRVGEAYWPEGMTPESEATAEPPPPAPVPLGPPSGAGAAPVPPPPPPPPPQGIPAASPTAAPAVAAGGAVPRPSGAPGQGAPAAVAWGEAGGFPRPPKSVATADVRGPIFFEAAKDPLSILMAVLLAAVVGGMGAYLGWRLGSEEAVRRMREETEQRLVLARTETEARHAELEKQLQEARARIAEIERANSVIEQQGKERDKAMAAAQAAAGALREENEALKRAKAEGEGAVGQVADLVALRGEQERLLGLLREAVGDTCEVGPDGPYIFIRAKVPLYAEGSTKPAEDIISAMKKVAAVAKAYVGPYRLQVEGHTDSSPGPTVAGQGSNLHAGAMRALDIAQVLVDAGVGAPKMSLVSQGEAFPVRTGADAVASKANRRVEIIFAPTRQVVATAPEPTQAPATPAAPGTAPAPEAPRAIPVLTIPTEAQTPPAPQDPVPDAPAVIQAGTAREGQASPP